MPHTANKYGDDVKLRDWFLVVCECFDSLYADIIMFQFLVSDSVLE